MQLLKNYRRVVLNLIIVLLVQVIVPFSGTLAYDLISDPDTSETYVNKLISDESGSKNAGRLWSDKSVNTKSIMLTDSEDGIEAEVSTGSDFLHTYSILSSSQLVNEEVPLDVMFVLDISESMKSPDYQSADQTVAIRRTINALNNSIKKLLKNNPSARFGIACFSSKGATVLELGFYKPLEGTNFASVYTAQSKGFDITFRYLDENDEEHTLIISNNDTTDTETKVESWKGIVRNKNGKDYIFDGSATNVQAGLKAGLSELANAKDTVVVSPLGNVISRIPAMILLTDGSANTIGELDVTTDMEIPPNHNFVDVNKIRGDAYFNYSTFDTSKDFAHSNNYFDLYGFDKELGQYIDNTTESTVEFLINDKEYTEHGYNPYIDEYGSDDTPLILSTLLTASYYTAAVNDHYQSVGMNNNVSNLTNVKLQNYTIFASTSGPLSTSEENMDIVNAVLNPSEYFTSRSKTSDAYDVYTAWLNDPEISRQCYTSYIIGDILTKSTQGFYDNSEEFWAYWDEYLSYDPETDGNYDDYNRQIYYKYLNQYAVNHFGMPTTVKTYINMKLSDSWLDDPTNNPYGVSSSEVKSNVYYLPSKNALKVNTSEIESTFENIIEEISGKAFISVSGANSLDVENAVTYMDPIGEYMEVSDSVKVDGNNSDMFVLLNGNFSPLVKVAVYDYQFNNTYVGINGGSFPEGWYLGDDPQTTQFNGNSGSWEEGYVYRARFNSAVDYVPTLSALTDTNNNGEIDAEDITEKQKNTVYTLYRFDLEGDTNGDIRRSWRINPSYIGSVEDITKDDYDPETYIITNQEKQDYFNSLEKERIPDGIYRLSDIRIWVEDTGDYKDKNPDNSLFAGLGYDQALYVNIPASSIPTQIAEISYNERNDSIEYQTNLDNYEASSPLRIFYSVGVQDDIKVDNGDTIDLSKVNKSYIDSHTNEDGKVYFYSNYYSANSYDGYLTEDRLRTRGDPVTTFSPEIDDRYYVYQHFHILYTGLHQVSGGNLIDVSNSVENGFENVLKYEAFANEAEALEAIANGSLVDGDYVLLSTDVTNYFDRNINYFAIIRYYTEDPNEPGKAVESKSVTLRKGVVFELDVFENVKESETICWYNPNNPDEPYVLFEEDQGPEGYVLSTRPGGIRLGDMAQGVQTKGVSTGGAYTSENYTSTANNYYLPTLASNSGTGDNILINSYNGNNGLVLAENTMLFVTKLVADEEGDFVKSNEPLTYKEFDYQVFIEGYSGTRDAIKVQWDDQFNLWRRRIATIDVVTDNNGLLQDPNYNPALFTEDGNAYDAESGGQAYYIYVRDLRSDEEKTNLQKEIVRVYSAADYDGASAPSGTRTRNKNGVYFNASEVYLIPKEIIDANPESWEFNENIYKKLNDFTVATMQPEDRDGRTNGMDIVSPYAIKSEYLTVSLDFGINNENLDSEADFKAPTKLFDSEIFSMLTNAGLRKFINPDKLEKCTAQFTLKHGESLLFASIPTDTFYRISERLDPEEKSSWELWPDNEELTPENASPNIKAAVKNLRQNTLVLFDSSGDVTGVYNVDTGAIYDQAGIENTPNTFTIPSGSTESEDRIYSIYGNTAKNEEGVHFINTTETTELTLEKELEASENTEITDIDRNTNFTFNISFTYPEEYDLSVDNSVSYPYEIYRKENDSEELVLEKEGYLVGKDSSLVTTDNDIKIKEQDDEKFTWEVSLNSNQVLKITDILSGTRYEVTEQDIDGFEEVLENNNSTHSGELVLNPESDDQNKVVITNKKTDPDPISINLEGTKFISSENDSVIKDNDFPKEATDEYSFIITPQEDIKGDPITEPKEVKNDSEGKIVFFDENTVFTRPGIYTYLIEEKDFDSETTKKDDSKYQVIITVSEDYSDTENKQYTKKLKADVKVTKVGETDKNLEDLEFTNLYTPLPTSINLEGTKIFKYDEGHDSEIPLQGGEFSFGIVPDTNSPGITENTATNDEKGHFSFGPIEFTEPGTFSYRITEINLESKEFVIYDDTIYYVRVVVVDEDGQLVATPNYLKRVNASNFDPVDAIEFINIFETGNLKIHKHVSFEDNSTQEFEFTLKTNKDLDGEYGDVTFENGVSNFTLKDGNEIVITGLPLGTGFELTENNYEDYLTKYVSSKIGVIQKDTDVKVDVINHKINPVTTSIQGHKTLESNDSAIILSENEFNFILSPSTENPEGDPLQGVTQELSNDSEGNFDIPLTFTKVGTYNYTLMEVEEVRAGYTYDSNSYHITITVSYDENNQLKVDKIIEKIGTHEVVTEPVEFNNKYSAGKTSFIVKGTKTFTNGHLSGNDFEFELIPQDGAPVPITNIVTTKNDQDGNFSFDAIEFDNPGIFTYLVSELPSNKIGVVDSEVIYTVTITVTNVDNQLVAQAEYSQSDSINGSQVVDSINFINTQKVGSLDITKNVVGPLTDKVKEYKFTLTLYNDQEYTNIAEYINGIYGELTFVSGVAEFTLHDLQTKKAEGLPSGLYYSVVEDEYSEFETQSSNDKNVIPDDSAQSCVFINTTKQLTYTSYPIKVLKSIIGNAPTEGDIFTFVLKDANEPGTTGYKLPNGSTITINGPGEVKFDPIEFTEAGTYAFEVSEINIPSTYNVDKEDHKIVLTVNEKDRALSVDDVKVDGSDPIIVFTNTFLEPVETFFEGTKILKKVDGSIKEVEPEEFSFIITPDSSNDSYDPVPKEGIAVKNDESGKFKFDHLTYTHKGNYHYTVTEVDEGKEVYTYDPTIYHISVKVENDKQAKTLNLTKTIYTLDDNNHQNDTDKDIEFNNTYSPISTNLSINGSKDFINGKLRGNDFEYTLTPKVNGELDLSKQLTTKNKEDGTFEFNLDYSEEGIYEYEVSEIQGNDSSIIYSQLTYDVIVTVEDIDGQLQASYEVRDKDQVIDNLVFTNKQKAGDLRITKEVHGLSETSDQKFIFTVTLYTDDSYENRSVARSISGVYGQMEFNRGQAIFELGKDEEILASNLPIGLYYQVEEEANDEFILQDSDKLTGAIEENQTINIDLVNVRSYIDPYILTLPVNKRVINKPVETPDSDFTFRLGLLEGDQENVVLPEDRTIQINGAGTRTFGTIQINEAGTYKFVVTEINIPDNYQTENRQQTVTVVIELDEESRSLICSDITYSSNDPEGLVFTNIYQSPVSTSFVGTKTLTDTDSNILELSGGEFTFILEPSVNNNADIDPVPAEGLLVTNDNNGNFGFEIMYDHPGWYSYTLKEESNGSSDFIFDSDVYSIDIVVMNNSANTDNSLTLLQHIRKNGVEVGPDQILFNNIYYPNITSFVIEGTKAFENGILKGDDFTFTIEPLDGAPAPEELMARNDSAGYFNFGSIIFDTVGTYYYKVKEVDPNITNINSSDEVFTVEINVQEDSEGRLYSSASYQLNNSLSTDFIKFTNVLDVGELEVTKTVVGTLNDKSTDFDFIVTLYNDEERTQVAEYITGTYGEMSFENGIANIQLHHGQTISATDIPSNLFYSVEETETVGFEIEERNTSGAIKANDVVSVEFRNTRDTVVPVDTIINVSKLIDGNPKENSTFTFELTTQNDDGVILPENNVITIEGSGKEAFNDITFTKAGTYEFTITEINIPEDYVNDAPIQNVTIEVEESEKVLSVENIVYEERNQEAIFVNIYEDSTQKPMVGIGKLHKIKTQDYHANLNEVDKKETVSYLLRIPNSGGETAHNLVISDPIPRKMKLNEIGIITLKDSTKPIKEIEIDLTPYYDSNSGILEISQLEGKGIDLDPGQELDIEYSVVVPRTMTDETYWTNHAWLTYDELEAEYNESLEKPQEISALSVEDNSVTLGSEQGTSDFINFDKIDLPIELELVNVTTPDYHSMFYNDNLTVNHVKYSNDVREHYIPVVTTPAEDPTPEEGSSNGRSYQPGEDEGTVSHFTEQKETLEEETTKKSDTTPDESKTTTNQDEYSENSDLPEGSKIKTSTDLGENYSQNSTVNNSANSSTQVSTTAPKTGVHDWIITLIIFAILASLVMGANYFYSKQKN